MRAPDPHRRVEMEALTACAFAALSMANALRRLDPNAQFDDLALPRKEGGQSGSWGQAVPNSET